MKSELKQRLFERSDKDPLILRMLTMVDKEKWEWDHALVEAVLAQSKTIEALRVDLLHHKNHCVTPLFIEKGDLPATHVADGEYASDGISLEDLVAISKTLEGPPPRSLAEWLGRCLAMGGQVTVEIKDQLPLNRVYGVSAEFLGDGSPHRIMMHPDTFREFEKQWTLPGVRLVFDPDLKFFPPSP